MPEFGQLRRIDDPNRRRLRRGMYVLPSLFTSANIAFGFFAILQVIQGDISTPYHFDWAAKAIGIAAAADFLDGMIARMTNTATEFGRELDSLADVITFGVAPAVLAWKWGVHFLQGDINPDLRLRITHLGAIASFLFLVACASRLARFNIQKNPQPSNPGKPGRKYFVGMPTPAGAGVIAASVHLINGEPLTVWWIGLSWAALVVCAGFLMVSTWRYFSLKGLNLRARQPFTIVLFFAVPIALTWYFSEIFLFTLAMGYMLAGVFLRLGYAIRRRPSPPAPAPATEGA
jgi:CDP-diacylglycerol--serine O-phosphatidyltransferase